MFDYPLPVQIPYILNPAALHANVDVAELLPDATHCFYNLARSWFWLEKSDLKPKQSLKLLFDSQVRHSCMNRSPLNIPANKCQVYSPCSGSDLHHSCFVWSRSAEQRGYVHAVPWSALFPSLPSEWASPDRTGSTQNTHISSPRYSHQPVMQTCWGIIFAC